MYAIRSYYGYFIFSMAETIGHYQAYKDFISCFFLNPFKRLGIFIGTIVTLIILKKVYA